MKKLTVNKVRELTGHRNAIYNICDGSKPGTIFATGADRFVAEWSIEKETGETIFNTDAPVYGLKYDQASNILAVGLSDGGIHFLDPSSKKVLKSSKVHDRGVFEFLFLGDGRLLAASEDGHLSIWDLEKFEATGKLRLTTKSIRTLSLNPVTKEVAVGSSDNKIYILGEDLNVKREWEAHSLSVFRTIWSPSNGLLISTGRDAHIRVWDPKQNYKEIISIPAHMYAINDLVFDDSRDLLFSGSMDKSIRVWDTQTFQLLKVINREKHECHVNGVNRLLFRNGQLISCGDDRKIMVWEIKDRTSHPQD